MICEIENHHEHENLHLIISFWFSGFIGKSGAMYEHNNPLDHDK